MKNRIIIIVVSSLMLSLVTPNLKGKEDFIRYRTHILMEKRIIKTEEIYQVKTHLNSAFRCVFSWKYFNLDISIHHKASLK